MNFICSGDDLDRLPQSKQFSLLKKNLPGAVVLVKVFGFNIRTWTEEMHFVFTNLDNQQFKVRGAIKNETGLIWDNVPTFRTLRPLSTVGTPK